MRFEDKITVELNQMDAAIAAVLLAENAGQLALKALLADRTAEGCGTTNKDTRALADAYIKVGNALTVRDHDREEEPRDAEHRDARPKRRDRGSSCRGVG